MKYKQILRTASILILLISIFMLTPIIPAVYYKEYSMIRHFLNPLGIFAVLLFVIIKFFGPASDTRETMNIRDGFLLVTLSWLISSFLGAFPFWLSGEIPKFSDAYFETMSGFTTTGASVLTNIEALPKCLLFWRSLTHWLGGMGIVVLTVALLPLLGAGGVHLLRAEAPGPTVDKTMPRIKDTAKTLWLVYTAFTVIETFLLMLGGMSFFDALTHTFGTLATGGFSTKNSSVGHYNSAYIDGVITLFMIMAGINFTLYFRALSEGVFRVAKNLELKVYISIFLIISVLIAINLTQTVFPDFLNSFRYSSFQTASILTTTGYATADYDKWPEFSKSLLFLLMFIGGCSGSTGGGIKVIRVLTLFRLGVHEMKCMAHPRGIFNLKIDNQVMHKNFVYPIAGFVFLYMLIILVTTIVVSSQGLDLTSSFSTAFATLGNIGPGFNAVGPTCNYSQFSEPVIWFLSFIMMIGRLELYTVLILITGRFWQ